MKWRIVNFSPRTYGVNDPIAGGAVERHSVNFAFLGAAGPARQVCWVSAARPAPLLLAAGFPDPQAPAPAALRLRLLPRRDSGSEVSLARRCLVRGEDAAIDAGTLASPPKRRRRLDAPDMGPTVAALLRQVGQGAPVSQVCVVARACVQAGRSKISLPLPYPEAPHPRPGRQCLRCSQPALSHVHVLQEARPCPGGPHIADRLLLLAPPAPQDGFLRDSLTHLASLGTAGRHAQNQERDLYRWTNGLAGLHVEPYYLRLPLERRGVSGLVMQEVPVIIPFELVDAIAAADSGQADRSFLGGAPVSELVDFWAWAATRSWGSAAAGIPSADRHRTLPIVYFYDGVEFHRDTEHVVWLWGSLLGGGDVGEQRFPLLTLPASRVLKESTMELVQGGVARFVSWVMTALRLGSRGPQSSHARTDRRGSPETHTSSCYCPLSPRLAGASCLSSCLARCSFFDGLPAAARPAGRPVAQRP